jgi:TetR/AcrR family transcriptional regulator, transcriptional repressor for nem operon
MTKATATRMVILEKAFELIYVKGYQATSIDDIIARTKVTKGAFFYHFKNKDEMGLAVITDLMTPHMNSSFVNELKSEKDPVKAIYNLMEQLLLKSPLLLREYGCPAGNLSQEMSPLDAHFSQALLALFDQWKDKLKASINKGKKAGLIRKDVDAKQVAYFVMAGYWGIRNVGKLDGSADCYRVYLKQLKHYLKSLR